MRNFDQPLRRMLLPRVRMRSGQSELPVRVVEGGILRRLHLHVAIHRETLL